MGLLYFLEGIPRAIGSIAYYGSIDFGVPAWASLPFLGFIFLWAMVTLLGISTCVKQECPVCGSRFYKKVHYRTYHCPACNQYFHHPETKDFLF